MSKAIVFEFSGVVRIFAKQRDVHLTIADTATWCDVIAVLAQAVPALVGEVIAKDKRHLVGDYLINVDGTMTINNLEERAEVKDGTHLIFLTDAC